MERTMQQLKSMQAAPLDVKVLLTKQRIREWVNEFGLDGVYVSFSGGKDSTVLLHIVREMYPSVPAVFCDTGLEYPEIRDFVRTFDNVEWLKPKMTFRQVIEKYGYPFLYKIAANRVKYGQKYVRQYYTPEIFEEVKRGNIPAELEPIVGMNSNATGKVKQLFGTSEHTENGKGTGEVSTMYNYRRYAFAAFCPYQISDSCCDIMKKEPMHNYGKKTGRVPLTAQMASESRQRKLQWQKNGCNVFDTKYPISNPMSFWNEQDVLKYIRQNKIPLASIYGEIVNEDSDGMQYTETLCEMPLKTTGANRTGCMFCGFGCHFEKPGEGRFERMKKTHPKQYEWIMKDWDAGGLGYKRVIDWLNENGNLHIRY